MPQTKIEFEISYSPETSSEIKTEIWSWNPPCKINEKYIKTIEKDITKLLTKNKQTPLSIKLKNHG